MYEMYVVMGVESAVLTEMSSHKIIQGAKGPQEESSASCSKQGQSWVWNALGSVLI